MGFGFPVTGSSFYCISQGIEKEKLNFNNIMTPTNSMDAEANQDTSVTVFDFSTILERIEKRVRDDLLGAGPGSVEELRIIHSRLQERYRKDLDRKLARAAEQQRKREEEANLEAANGVGATLEEPNRVEEVMGNVGNAVKGAVGVFSKMKTPGFNALETPPTGEATPPTEQDATATATKSSTASTEATPDLLSGSSDKGKDDVEAEEVAAAVGHFSIDDDEDL